ncbi:hypothetical protein JM654_20595 [Microbacterium oxydans]|nr:hypothetical protein [Microbacterium oxydans]
MIVPFVVPADVEGPFWVDIRPLSRRRLVREVRVRTLTADGVTRRAETTAAATASTDEGSSPAASATARISASASVEAEASGRACWRRRSRPSVAS